MIVDFPQNKNVDIYTYGGFSKQVFDDELLLEYCEKIQKMLYSHNPAFVGFDNDTLYALDASIRFLSKYIKNSNEQKCNS